MLAVREGKDAVSARNFSDALQKAMIEKHLMGRGVDSSEERPTGGMAELDLNKLMEQMMRAGVGLSGGEFARQGERGPGGRGNTKERDTKRRKVPPGDIPFQDPDLD